MIWKSDLRRCFKNTGWYGWMEKIPRTVWVISVLHCSSWKHTDYGNL